MPIRNDFATKTWDHPNVKVLVFVEPVEFIATRKPGARES